MPARKNIKLLQCINVKLKLKFAIELQAVYLRGTTYLRPPLFGMIPVVTLCVRGAGAVNSMTDKSTTADKQEKPSASRQGELTSGGSRTSRSDGNENTEALDSRYCQTGPMLIRAVHGNGNPRGNGNRFGLWTGMGMGILSREWEWRILLYVKNSHYCSRQMCRVNSLLFLHSNMQ